MEFTFITEYLPGPQNTLADALSRCYEDDISVKSIVSDDYHQKMIWEAELRGLELLKEGKRKDLVDQQHTLGHFGAKLIAKKIREMGWW